MLINWEIPCSARAVFYCAALSALLLRVLIIPLDLLFYSWTNSADRDEAAFVSSIVGNGVKLGEKVGSYWKYVIYMTKSAP